jgi:rhamnosyltransferase
MAESHPSCAVLLATYNGQLWLTEQLESLRTQQGVYIHIIVSDDQSSDGTMDLLFAHSSKLPISILPFQSERFGNANRNFLRLIRDADIGDAEYIALADQDDIWRADKLKRGIDMLRADGASAYSSDFEAFWQDGRMRIVKKSHPQKQFDHLFGSPGPGCTFVFTRSLFLEMRALVNANIEVLSRLWVHDWVLYALARSLGHRWFIDNVPNIRYRQHESNEIGVNLGAKALFRRLAVIKEGRYRYNILSIMELTDVNSDILLALRRLKLSDRIWLIRHAGNFRRSLLDVWALRLIFVLMPATPIPEFE